MMKPVAMEAKRAHPARMVFGPARTAARSISPIPGRVKLRDRRHNADVGVAIKRKPNQPAPYSGDFLGIGDTRFLGRELYRAGNAGTV